MFQLHHVEVTAKAAEPARWALMLHGIFGSGGNWRTFARRLADRLPGWGVVLADLRGHGRSRGAPPPHTVEAAAVDLAVLDADFAIDAVIGHSFGGKVALAYAALRPVPPAQVWVLDVDPDPRPEALAEGASTVAVLELMERLPAEFSSRDAFVDAVVAAGHGQDLAQWLAMNVRPGAGGAFRNELELPVVRALLTDFYAVDAWPMVDRLPDVRFAVGGASAAVSRASRARAPVCHVLEGAGHWLNVDAPDALLALVAAGLQQAGGR